MQNAAPKKLFPGGNCGSRAKLFDMRTDIAGQLFTVSDLLEPEECLTFIERGESIGFEAASVSTPGGPKMLPGVRNNDLATFDDPALAEWFRQRIAPFVPPTINGRSASGQTGQLQMNAFRANDQFPGGRRRCGVK
jgi:hypothetical protein